MQPAELFQHYKSGDSHALNTLIQAERANLHAYLYWMTGRSDIAQKGLEEVIEAVFGSAQRYKSYDELKISLYTTCRSFHADIWDRSPSGLVSLQDHDASDQNPSLAHLEPQSREALLLCQHAGFSLAEAAKIMGLAPEPTQAALQKAQTTMQQKPAIHTQESLEIPAAQPYDLEGPSSGFEEHSTMALSQVIENVKSSRMAFVPRWLVISVIGFITVWLVLTLRQRF